MNPDLQPLISGIGQANSIIVVLPQNPSLDVAASALSLNLAINKAGKSSKVVSPTPMTAGLSRLVGVDKVSNQISNKNLIISFSVPEEAIEKVSYNYDNSKLNFVVEPAKGHTAPSQSQVNFSYAGIDADLVVYVGVNHDAELGKLQENQELVNHPNQHHLNSFAANPFDFGSQSALSAVTVQVIEGASLQLDEDIASNLMLGIDSVTQNLTKNVSPEALEAAAKLLRAGAVRNQLTPSQPESFSQPQQPQQQQQQPRRQDQRPPFRGPKNRDFRPRFETKPTVAPQPIQSNQPSRPQQPAEPSQPRPQFIPQESPKPQQQQPQPQLQPQPQPQAAQSPQNQPTPEDTDPENPSPQPDWFEPKIYKGSTLI